jgi:hypothetical protein
MVNIVSAISGAGGNAPPRIRVWPANESVRKVIFHPAGKIRFAETLEESVEWPYDTFTRRRIADGDILLEGPGQQEAPAEAPKFAAPKASKKTAPEE